MEWPAELIELFNDPLLDGVHPKATAPKADDRLIAKLEEITQWVEANGRNPQQSGSLKERLLYASLQALREQAGEDLKAYDRMGLMKDTSSVG